MERELNEASQVVLTARGIRCLYGEQAVLDGVELDIADGEICALLGPSGCGKTTLLKSLAGLIPIADGQIRLHQRELSGLKAEQRNIGLIFQDYALFPHLTVLQNVAYGLFEHSKAEQQQISRRMLAMVGLGELEARYPYELSGGQQQRVAIARALARKPDLMLLDEPFSNIDPRVRSVLIEEVRALLKQQGIPAILVTHNKEEAFALADRILILDQGKIAQQGSAESLYTQPRSKFVAELLGSANWLPIERRVDGRLSCALGELEPQELAVVLNEQLLLRPHQLCVEADPAGEAVVESCRFLGSAQLLHLSWRGQMLQVETPVAAAKPLTTGSRVRLALAT